jgi:hypothetical protein
MREEIFQGPVIAQRFEQIVVRMGVGIHETWKHDVPCGVQLLGTGCGGEFAPDGDDLLSLNEHIGRFEGRLGAI